MRVRQNNKIKCSARTAVDNLAKIQSTVVTIVLVGGSGKVATIIKGNGRVLIILTYKKNSQLHQLSAVGSYDVCCKELRSLQ